MRWTAALLLLLSAAPASAETSPFLKPTDPVPGHPGLTWLDLVRQAVPSLAKTDDGDIEGSLKTPPPRHIGGASFEGDPPDPVTLGDIEVKHILAGGQKRMVVMADLGPDPDRVQSQTLLLLFDVLIGVLVFVVLVQYLAVERTAVRTDVLNRLTG